MSDYTVSVHQLVFRSDLQPLRQDDRYQQRERRRHGDFPDPDNYASHQRGQRPSYDDGDQSRPSYQGQRGFAPPSGPPPRRPAEFGSLGGLDRGDFASDEDINRMVATGEFEDRRGSGRQAQGLAYGRGAGGERGGAYGGYGAPTG